MQLRRATDADIPAIAETLALALAMLAGNVREFAAHGLTAHLESTIPANDRRYERAGFRAVGVFTSPFDDASPITTMWRAMRADALAGISARRGPAAATPRRS